MCSPGVPFCITSTLLVIVILIPVVSSNTSCVFLEVNILHHKLSDFITVVLLKMLTRFIDLLKVSHMAVFFYYLTLPRIIAKFKNAVIDGLCNVF